MVLSGIVEEYVLKFVREHESIPAVEDFHFCDYDDFVAFAKDKEFDYRTSSRTSLDQLRKSLEDEGLAEAASAQLAELEKALDIPKEEYLRMMKDEIIQFIEEEIAVRYYFQEAGIKVRLRYDEQLKTALTLPPISW